MSRCAGPQVTQIPSLGFPFGAPSTAPRLVIRPFS
jgi:hypothetical protein